MRYVVNRLLMLIPLLLGVSILTFFLIHLAPGDPISTRYGLKPENFDAARLAELREELGLNDPLPVQYLRYLRDLLRGDMGTSLTTNRPVSEEILARFPATLQLTIASMLFVLLVAVPLGIVSAVKRGSWMDQFCMGCSLLGVSMPGFWFGIMLMLLFSQKLGWLPSIGRGDTFPDLLKSLIMPAITLGTGMTGLVTRLTRSSMLEVLGQNYMQTARAKGLPERVVLLRHGLRNALIPVVTVMGTQFASLLGGAVVIEQVFAWPGMGRLAIDAVLRRNYPVVMGTVLVFSVTFVLSNLMVDILYTIIDPRIRYDREAK